MTAQDIESQIAAYYQQYGQGAPFAAGHSQAALDVNGNLKELYVHCTYDPLKTYDEIEAEGGNLGKFLKELTKRGGLKKTWIPKLVG